MRMCSPCLAVVAVAMMAWASSASAQSQPTPARARPIAAEGPMAEATLKPVPSATPLAATVQLNIGTTHLSGTLLSASDVVMKTSFGEVTVPFSEVAGIKLASAGDAKTTVVLHNGDSVTGACDIGRIELQMEWGTATINGDAINSILFAPGMAWVSESGLHGTRWTLMAKPGTKTEENDSASTDSNIVAKPTKTFRPGDIITVSWDSDLKVGGEVVGTVGKGEVLAVEKVQDSWVWVDNGKTEGWVYTAHVSEYKRPGSEGAVADTVRNRNR